MAEGNNIQNFPDSPGPSTKIQSETYNNDGFDNVFKSKRWNSTEFASNEIIDIPSDSDDDQDYYNNTSNDDFMNDVSIIKTVKPVASDTASSNLPSNLTDDFSSKPLINMTNLVPVLASSSDREATSIRSKIQDRSRIKDIKKNNVSYSKTVSKKKISENPKPGCSKDSDDISSKEDDLDMEEMIKDIRMIQALLPRLDFNVIFEKLINNKYAKNCIELTLWDLLPRERPLVQDIRKRKSSDNVCIVECKKNANLSLQKSQVDTETAIEKKEQHVMNDNIGKLEDRIFGNTPEVAVLNDTNNDIDQPSAMPMETKLDDTLDEPMCIEQDNDINMDTVQDSKIFVLSKTNLKTKKLQSTKNSEINPDNKTTFPTGTTVLQPAKFTFETNPFIHPQRINMVFKSPSILSPPKLHFIHSGDLQHLQQIPIGQKTKQNRPIVLNANLDVSVNDSFAIRLPDTSSNDKTASGSARRKLNRLQRSLSNFANMEGQKVKLVDVYTGIQKSSYDQPSCSVQTLCNSEYNNRVPNISEHQVANSSKACNFDPEAGNVSTSQIYNRRNGKQVRMRRCILRKLVKFSLKLAKFCVHFIFIQFSTDRKIGEGGGFLVF